MTRNVFALRGFENTFKKWRIASDNGAVGRCIICHLVDAGRHYNDPDLEEIIEESVTRTVVRKLTVGHYDLLFLFRVRLNYARAYLGRVKRTTASMTILMATVDFTQVYARSGDPGLVENVTGARLTVI